MIEKEVREVEELRYELLHIVDVTENNKIVFYRFLNLCDKRNLKYIIGDFFDP
jgi:hypothetical protein